MNRNIISSIIARHAMVNPDKIAINYQERIVLTYASFMEIFDGNNNNLSSVNINGNDRFLAIFESHVNYLLVVLPLVESAVFTSAQYPSDIDALKEKLELYNITYIITDSISENLVETAKTHGCGILQINIDTDSLRVIFSLIVQKRLMDYPVSSVAGLALITQTSGTTAIPKLIPKSYQLLWENCIQEHEVYDANEHEIRLITAPVHRTNTAFSVIKFLYSNAQVLCTDGVNSPLILSLLENHSVTHFRAAPASINSFLDYLDSHNITPTCSSLQFIFVTGAAINDRFVERVRLKFDAELIHTYGSTETSNITSNYKLPSGYRSGSVGVATYHEVKIIDGEICVKGRTVFQGYENVENSEYFTDGFFRTGDAGYLDADGYLYITGRIKEMINRGGEKVSPYEVEKEIDQLGLFREFAIFPYPGENLLEEIGLVGVLIDEKISIRLRDVRARLINKVSTFKLPTKLILVNEIPKSTSNKIQRKQLYTLLLPYFNENEPTYVAESIVLTDSERILLELYKKILNISMVDLSDNFFALGGDSLKAAELYNEVEVLFHVKLPMVELFNCTSVSEMGRFIERFSSKDKGFKFIVPLVKKDNDLGPLVFVHAVAGDAITYRHLASKMNIDRSIYAIEFNIEKSEWNLPLETDQILDEYVNELAELCPEGSFVLSGLSMGGRIALEIAHRLRMKGIHVSCVIMMDTVFVKGNKKGKNFNLKRAYQRVIFDLQTKRHGDVYPYLLFKANKFFQNRLAKRSVKNYVKSSVQNKIVSQNRRFKPVEIEILISTYFKTTIRDSYDVEVIYLLAKKENNTANADFVALRTKNFQLIEVDCYHSDFVSLHASETALILDKIIQSIIH